MNHPVTDDMIAERLKAAGLRPTRQRVALGTLLFRNGDRHVTAEMLHDGVRDGIWGWFDDDLALTDAWGFELREIAVPLTVWHGGRDQAVPFAHGAWLAERIPGARAELHPDEGHLSLAVARYDDVLDDLIAPRREHP